MVGSFSLLMFVPLVMNVALARELGAKDAKQGFFQQKTSSEASFLDTAMKQTGATSYLETETKVGKLQARLAAMEKITEEFRAELADAVEENAYQKNLLATYVSTESFLQQGQGMKCDPPAAVCGDVGGKPSCSGTGKCCNGCPR